MIISERVAELRKECGMTQEQLGLKVGVSSQAVSKWENGGAPDVELLPVIADVLSVRETAWLAMEGQEAPSYWIRSVVADDSGTMMTVTAEEAEQLLEGMVDCGLLSSLDIQTENDPQKAWQQKSGEALVPFLYLARWLMQKKYLYFYGWNVREEPWLKAKKNG